MTKTFTENEIVQYVYGDLSKLKSAEIEQSLSSDPSLRRKVQMLSEVKDRLSKLEYTAPVRVTDKILAYSKGLQAEDI